MGQALDGIRVLDLTQYEAGPSCTEMLAWLGAEVVKVEPPAGEVTRTVMSDQPGMDSWYFVLLNANKKSVTLNLKSERGRLLFERMVADADVVVENLGPGSMDRLGLGYERLRQINPRIIAASIKGFGSTGPYAAFKSFEPIAQAMGGAISLTGTPETPVRINAGLGDTGAGMHCAIGILAAIVQRGATGVGQRVEVAQQDAVVNLIRIRFRDTYLTGKATPRRGTRTEVTAPSNLYRCRPFGPNDYVYIHGATVEMWKALVGVLGRPELGDDPRFKDRRSRAQHQEDIDAMVEAWTEKRTKHEAMETLGAAGVPCGAVLDTRELLEDPSLVERGMMVPIDHPARGRVTFPGNPVRLSASPTTVTPSPLLGEHNEEIYGTRLGCTAEELSVLKRDGVI
jgi:formyl-CoA transferase